VPFRLDLLRHGDAVLAGSEGDAARVLSAIGRRDVARMAEEYVRRGWRPERVFASPLRRAQETAGILISRLGGSTEFDTLAELLPDSEPDNLLAALRQRAPAGHVLAIGHQPLLGQLAILLTGDRRVAFPPAGMARIEFDDALGANGGRLVERVLPETLD
jgi:phosphohistidine phosphatase SixA